MVLLPRATRAGGGLSPLVTPTPGDEKRPEVVQSNVRESGISWGHSVRGEVGHLLGAGTRLTSITGEALAEQASDEH